MIESYSNKNEETAQGGSYEASRLLIEEERQRRTRILLAMQAVDMAYIVPVDPMDDLMCESCQ